MLWPRRSPLARSPGGAHPAWGAGTGFGLQVAGHLAYRQQVRWRLIPHLW